MEAKPFTPCLLTSTDRTDAIKKAQQRVVYCGPGMSAGELDAIVTARQRLPDGSLQVLVDLTPATFQAGYWGELEPARLRDLLKLDAHAVQASGLRMGILIVDNTAYLYTPTPLSLESDKTTFREPNCLQLNAAETQSLYASIVRPPVGVDASTEKSTSQRPPITEAAVEKVVEDLKTSGYVPPSEKRLLDRLRERLSIVQFQVTGYQLSRRNIQLPREVVEVLGSKETAINERLLASWRLFRPEADKGLAAAQKELDKALAEIKRKWLKRLSHYGFGLAHNVQSQFEADWARFQTELVGMYQAKLRERVESLIADSQQMLEKLLSERAKSGQLKVPTHPSLFALSHEEEEQKYIHDLVLSVHWPKAADVVEGVRFSMWRVDITLDLLRNKTFVQELEKTFEFKLSRLEDNASPNFTTDATMSSASSSPYRDTA